MKYLILVSENQTLRLCQHKVEDIAKASLVENQLLPIVNIEKLFELKLLCKIYYYKIKINYI